MQLTKQQFDDVTIVRLQGQLDGSTAEDALSYFKSNYDEECSKLIVDFRQVDYISSAGLRVLLCVLRESRRRNGDLRLTGTRRNVNRVLAATGFADMLQVYDNVESGIASYAA